MDSLKKIILFFISGALVIGSNLGWADDTEIYYSNNIPDTCMGLDIGPETSMQYSMILSAAKKVIWNGTLQSYSAVPFTCDNKDKEVIENFETRFIQGLQSS